MSIFGPAIRSPLATKPKPKTLVDRLIIRRGNDSPFDFFCVSEVVPLTVLLCVEQNDNGGHEVNDLSSGKKVKVRPGIPTSVACEPENTSVIFPYCFLWFYPMFIPTKTFGLIPTQGHVRVTLASDIVSRRWLWHWH